MRVLSLREEWRRPRRCCSFVAAYLFAKSDFSPTKMAGRGSLRIGAWLALMPLASAFMAPALPALPSCASPRARGPAFDRLHNRILKDLRGRHTHTHTHSINAPLISSCVCVCVCVCTRRHAGQGAMLLLFGPWSSSGESRLYSRISCLRREGI